LLDAWISEPRHETRNQIVLVVDDEDLVRNYMRRVLVAAGYQVIGASNGLEALTHLEAAAVALVITDIRMPEMDGLELGAKISQVPGAPVVVYASASDHPPAGKADYYLQKPFSPTELTRMVRETLSRDAKKT
jgi:CheY-like chemotaxis protein